MNDKDKRAVDRAWRAIFNRHKINKHDFNKEPYLITAEKIKVACQHFRTTGEKEVRILCKQDTREKRPNVFIEKELFLLPVKNGKYKIIKGEGYVDIPDIESDIEEYESKLPFVPETTKIGNSEMQHLDHAYAISLIRSFMEDESLVLTIRGRKYTPKFEFNVGNFRITTESVQTEVDSGYEGKDKVVLVEAKNSESTNTIIRQLYYPYRQWQAHTKKKVSLLFFEKRGNHYYIWEFQFSDENNYNSIKIKKSACYAIINKERHGGKNEKNTM